MNYYLLFKSLHLISVISWMAGLIISTKNFCLSSQNSDEKKISEIFKDNGKKIIFLHNDTSHDFYHGYLINYS